MEIISNEILIDRNKKISQAFLIISLAFLVFGFIWSIRNPIERFGSLSYIVLIPAYILVQISIYLSNKWGRSPRPDEILQNALKGLNNDYSLINYLTSVPHILIGPAGAIILSPYHQTGTITFDEKKNEFKQKGGGNFIVKLFGQESLPRVMRESIQLQKDFSKYLVKNNVVNPITSEVVIIFHADDADIVSASSPIKVMHVDKLKNYIRKKAKTENFTKDQIESFKKDLLEIRQSK